MRVIVGLGNPGEKYQNNRHNVGYLAVDALLTRPLPNSFVVKKTDCFMNNSGEFVKKLVGQYKLNTSDLWVIHDDLDIPLGSYKIQFGKGPKDHKGLASIDRALGRDEYWHVRIGVDSRPLSKRTPGDEYVLQDFTQDEKEVLAKVLQRICKKLATS
ncbi:MAG: aminoacyl-tRNA hydrolase [Patescibacteria group bacterium]